MFCHSNAALHRQEDAQEDETEMEMSALRQENARLKAAADGDARTVAELEAKLANAEADKDSLTRRVRELTDNPPALVNEVGQTHGRGGGRGGRVSHCLGGKTCELRVVGPDGR